MSRAVGIVLGVAVGLAVAVFGGITLQKRHATGTWQVPTRGDLVRIKEKLARPGPLEPSRVIYLERNGVSLRGGTDDAPGGVSSVVAAAGLESVDIPRFRGSKATWSWIVGCVAKKFEPFNVLVTDKRPATGEYVMVAVGGKATLLGAEKKHAGGLAPFNSRPIPKAVVFAFSDSLRNRRRTICEVIGMEVGHAYGLDHGYHCRDLMTYLDDCGVRRFEDRDIACGESKPRACANGAATQNSHQHLLTTLGPALP